MSSIADLRAFLQGHKLPKMTAKKSVLMDAAIERGWRPTKQVSKEVSESSSDEEVPIAKMIKAMKPEKKIEKKEKPVEKKPKVDPPVFKKSPVKKPLAKKINKEEE
jgi:hypothetical protein